MGETDKDKRELVRLVRVLKVLRMICRHFIIQRPNMDPTSLYYLKEKKKSQKKNSKGHKNEQLIIIKMNNHAGHYCSFTMTCVSSNPYLNSKPCASDVSEQAQLNAHMSFCTQRNNLFFAMFC